MSAGLKEKLELSDSSPHVKLTNPYLGETEYLYHLGLNTENVEARFQDVKFVCMGGKPSRMKGFAEMMYEILKKPKNTEFMPGKAKTGKTLLNISESAGRYSLYKVGSVLAASHGIGPASISVLLHELLKLLRYAKSTDVAFIRIGTSGGLGIEPGTVVITDTGYSGMLEPYFKQVACGKEVKYNTKSHAELSSEIEAVAKSLKIKTVRGNTISSNDFYEEQGRLDGAVCSFTEEDKKNFLQIAFEKHGIVNMEMESSCIIAFCNRAKVKCAVVCAVVINRLLGDSVTDDIKKIKSWELYPQQIVAEFIKRKLSKT